MKYAAVAATAMASAGFVVIRLFPTQRITVFNSQDADLIAFGSHALVVFLTSLPLVGFQIVGAGYFQAVGKPKQSLILSLSRQVLILIPALLILPRFIQLDGILMAGPISDLTATALTGAWLLAELRYLNRRSAETVPAQLPASSPAGADL